MKSLIDKKYQLNYNMSMIDHLDILPDQGEKGRQEEIGRLLDRMEGHKRTLCYVFLVSFLAFLAGKGFGSLLARKTKPLSRL